MPSQPVNTDQDHYDLKPNKTLTISAAAPANRPYPPYTGMGRDGHNHKHNISGFDAALAFSRLSASAHKLFWPMVSSRCLDTNLCKVGKDLEFSKTDRSRMKRAYPELLAAKLMVRVERDLYLINPKAILPLPDRFEITWSRWVDECKKKNETPEPGGVFVPSKGPGFMLSSIP